MKHSTTNRPGAELWRERIDAQRGTGLSVRAWCIANDVHEHSFYMWRLKLGLSPAQGRPGRSRRRDEPVRFAEVIVTPAARSTPLESRQIGMNAVSSTATNTVESRRAGMNIAEPPVASIPELIRLRLSCERELILPASMPMARIAELIRSIEGTSSSIEGNPSSIEVAS